MRTQLQTELDAILHRAAVATLTDRAFLRVTGSDATRWLNGMVTNSVQALQPGEGCYAFLLNAQGRILGDCTVYREPEPAEPPSFLLEAQGSQLEAIRAHLEHFIIMDDVELTAASSELDGLLLAGPKSSEILQNIVPAIESPAPLRLQPGADNSLIFTAAGSTISRFEILGSPDVIANLLDAAQQHGATLISPEALEALRLLEGRPLYGRDITEKYLPQETNQPHALHFNKGCYLGQEIVERIRSRGQVHRLLTPLTLTGEFPKELPTPIEADGKTAGEITSAALVPMPEGDQILALGYVRRETLDTHQTLEYAGGAANPRSLTLTSASNPTESTHA